MTHRHDFTPVVRTNRYAERIAAAINDQSACCTRPPVYTGKSGDISAENTSPVGLSFSADGLKMYSNKSGSTDKLFEYDLTTALDPSTKTYNGVFFDYGATAAFMSEKVSGNDPLGDVTGFSDATGHFWKPDGTKLYFGENDASTVYQVDLSSAWDLSSATHTYGTRYRAGVRPISINLKDDGTKLYIFDNGGAGLISQHSLSTAYDITSGSDDGISFGTEASGGFSISVYATISPSGSKFYVIDSTSGADLIQFFTMSTPWDLSTGSYDNCSFSVAAENAAPEAIFFSPDNAFFYMAGRTAPASVFQYSIPQTGFTATAPGLGEVVIGGPGSVNGLPVEITTTGDVTVDPTSTTMTSTGIALSESVVSIPGADGSGQVQSSEDRDEIWVTVKRMINGEVKRYIEVFERDFEEGDDQEDCYYADSIITYDGDPATVITGLSHLEGETVKVLADGYIQSDKTVSSGQITLDQAASVVQIGLPYTHIIKPLRFEGGTAVGTAVGKTKQIFGVTFVLLNSHTLTYGPDAGHLRTIDFREVSDLTDTGVPFFTGERFEEFDDNWKTDPRIVIQSDDPTPFTLLALAPENDTRELK